MISASYPPTGRSLAGTTAAIRSSAITTSPRKGSPPNPSATRPPRSTVWEIEDMSGVDLGRLEEPFARHRGENLLRLGERGVDVLLGVRERDVVPLQGHRVHERALVDHPTVEGGVGLVVVAQQVPIAADFPVEEVRDEHRTKASDARRDAVVIGDRLEPGAHAIAQA